MAGLYGTPSSLVPEMASDAEEASTLVNQLLQNSTLSCMVSKTKTLPSPWGSPNVGALGFFPSEDPLEDPQRFGQFGNESGSDYQVKNGKLVAATSNAVADSSSSFNFSNPYDYVRDGKKDDTENDFFSTGVEDSDADTSFKENRISLENNSGDFICHVEKNSEGSEFPSKLVPPRTSSKRSRAAEVHNLSEKRRRSRINEKMKALQNLIPNSTKTDKASMLDEAIEYLKQLQLQVQMLMIRNGLSLHPMCLPGGLQPMVLSQTGMSFDEGHGFLNSSSGIAQNLVQSAFSLPKHSNTLNQSAIIPRVTNNINLDTSSISQPTAEVRVGHFNPSASSIDALDGTPQLLLYTRKIGKPSSDVS